VENFTRAELEVMHVLWNASEPLKPGELEERFPRPIRNAALRSLLLVLLEKGHVTRKRAGRAYVYQARTRPQRELRAMTRRMADLFAGGSRRTLIAQLVKQENLTAEDLAALQRVASGEAEPEELT